MKLLIESLGSLSDNTSKVVNLENNQTVTFDYLGNPVTINIDNIDENMVKISTSHKFSVEKNGKCSLIKAFDSFDIPLSEITILTMPIFDASFKLKFSPVKESD